MLSALYRLGTQGRARQINIHFLAVPPLVRQNERKKKVKVPILQLRSYENLCIKNKKKTELAMDLLCDQGEASFLFPIC